MKKLSTLTLAGAALLGIASVAPVHAANMGDSSPESTTVESLPAFAPCEAIFKRFDGATLKYGSLTRSSDGSEVVYAPNLIGTAEAAIRTAFYEESSCADYLLNANNDDTYLSFYVESDSEIKIGVQTANILFTVHEYNSAAGTSITYHTAPIAISIDEDTDSAKSATADAFISAVQAVEPVKLEGDELKHFLVYANSNFAYYPFRQSAYSDILAKFKGDGVTVTPYAYGYSGRGDKNVEYVGNAVGVYVGDVYYGPAVAEFYYEVGSATDDETGIHISYMGADADPAATFTVTPVSEDTASSVIRDEEEFIAAYDFSLKLGDTVFSSFPNGLRVSVPVPDELAGAENVYARYLNADGTVTESDIPVNVWGTSVMSVSSTTNTYAYFTVNHFSAYILVRTDNPIVISDDESTIGEPDGGYAPSSDLTASSASSLATVAAATVVLFAGAIIYRKSKRA